MKKQEKLALVESALEDFYGDQQFASSLRESVLYSIHAGGKRIRPFLLLETLEALHIAINLLTRRWLRPWNDSYRELDS